MTEYIEREAAIRVVNGQSSFTMTRSSLIDSISKLPAADVAPVVHTRWAHLGGDEWCCPVCGFALTTEGSWDKPTKKYCEDCGAKMDGGADR